MAVSLPWLMPVETIVAGVIGFGAYFGCISGYCNLVQWLGNVH
jgi:hypothetical protein